MRIGVISDTHGRTDGLAIAMNVLRSLRADFFIHCGDVADFGHDGDGVLSYLPAGKAAFVFGNNDFDLNPLRRYARAANLTCLDTHGTLELAGRRVFVTHGDRRSLIADAFDSGVDFLLTGHTHRPHDKTEAGVRWLNPGALYRARPRTCGLLDLASDTFDIHPVD